MFVNWAAVWPAGKRAGGMVFRENTEMRPCGEGYSNTARTLPLFLLSLSPLPKVSPDPE